MRCSRQGGLLVGFRVKTQGKIARRAFAGANTQACAFLKEDAQRPFPFAAQGGQVSGVEIRSAIQTVKSL